jgi:hypothetical protein
VARVDALGLLYLARGADDQSLKKFGSFVQSYKKFDPGINHKLFVIFKGYRDSEHLSEGLRAFSSLEFTPIHTSDESFDIGAYLDAARKLDMDRLCFLNTNSEVANHYWLAKLSRNLDSRNVGVVGATGSFESLNMLDHRIPRFPNVHIRSNAFMIKRRQLVDVLSVCSIRTKTDAFLAESGQNSITRCILRLGLSALIVGRDGRGYHPENWPRSWTFRQGDQSNLLVKDNVTRVFERLPWTEKEELSRKTWGRYINSGVVDLLPGSKG